jgi:hypothetical protein
MKRPNRNITVKKLLEGIRENKYHSSNVESLVKRGYTPKYFKPIRLSKKGVNPNEKHTIQVILTQNEKIHIVVTDIYFEREVKVYYKKSH